MNSIKQKEDNFYIILAVVCFVTNLSQMPTFVLAETNKYISISIWFLLLILILVKNKYSFSKIPYGIIFIAGFIISYILIIDIINGFNYLTIQLLYPLYLSFFIFFLGLLSSSIIEEHRFVKIIDSYTISALIVSIDVYRQFIQGADIFGRGYLYGSKNSVSQILFTALIFSILSILYKGTFIERLFKFFISGFMFYILIFLKSRATLLGIPVVLFMLIFASKIKNNIKLLILFLILIFFVSLTNNNFYDIVVNHIIAGGRDWSDLNDISSGRFSEWDNFGESITGFEFFGRGSYKYESFPLSVLIQFGIPVGSVLIILSMWPIFWGLKKLKKEGIVNISFILVSISYFVNGLFEQLAPFGPGTKCYMLWLMFGLLYGFYYKNKFLEYSGGSTS